MENSLSITCTYCNKANVGSTLYCTFCGKQIGTLDPRPNFLKRSLKYVGPKKLYRSRSERWIAGVCGGISEYYNINVNFLRAIFVILSLPGLFGVLIYLILIAAIEESPLDPWSE